MQPFHRRTPGRNVRRLAAPGSDFAGQPAGCSRRSPAPSWDRASHDASPARRSASLVAEPGGTSVSTHGLGYLFAALRCQGLIADELVLQLATFLRSLDLFLELIVLTPRTLTAYQVRHGGKQGTDNPELSRIHSGALASIDFTAAEPPAQRLTISLTARSFASCAAPVRPQRRLPAALLARADEVIE